MAIPDLILAFCMAPTGTGFSKLTDQQMLDLQAHSLDCDLTPDDCFQCWQVQKQTEADKLPEGQTLLP